MADISMKRDHDLCEEEVQAMIEQIASKVATRLGGSWHWQGDTAVCEARGARALVFYDERSISLDVTLPFVLKPPRRTLEAKIVASFERYLPPRP